MERNCHLGNTSFQINMTKWLSPKHHIRATLIFSKWPISDVLFFFIIWHHMTLWLLSLTPSHPLTAGAHRPCVWPPLLTHALQQRPCPGEGCRSPPLLWMAPLRDRLGQFLCSFVCNEVPSLAASEKRKPTLLRLFISPAFSSSFPRVSKLSAAHWKFNTNGN